MQLSADEIDLIDAWFAGGQAADRNTDQAAPEPSAPVMPATEPPMNEEPTLPLGERTARWWQETANTHETRTTDFMADNERTDEFPRIVRNRLKA